MTPESKSKLNKIIRGTQGSANVGLRGKLLKDLGDETKRRYHLTIKQLSSAGLDEANTAKRRRLEEWIAEQVRAESGKHKRTADDFLNQVVRQAAYTLLNRIVILRLMEAMELRPVPVVTGGWNSSGYRDFRQLAPALTKQQQDPTEGFSFLLQLVFEELATDMPGLYGSAGIADLIPVPPETLRAVIEAFDDPELESCWTDDMTLGWVYQYWNDPDREALDAKINDGGKIEPHEIASKTQMFTERYMVDWLLQNSLGPMWLAMCRKHNWTPECESSGTLDALEQRRIEWRAKRDAGEVSLTELMPLHTDLERRWAYYVPQPIPDDAVEHAPETVRDLKILDPAVGSGHFLVVAFDLLFALYEEEARHRAASISRRALAPGSVYDSTTTMKDDAQKPTASALSLTIADWSPQAITERILEHNLHGIDLDPRAVQIAAAALWLKAKRACAEARPAQVNLVASNLRLSSLPDDDPALVELRRAVAEETGIPADLTNSIVHALSGADHLGSLLKVDTAVEDAIRQHEATTRAAGDPRQRQLFDEGDPVSGRALAAGDSYPVSGKALAAGSIVRESTPQRFRTAASTTPAASALPLTERTQSRDSLKASVLERLEHFLSQHTSGDDLGLRMRGEQLAAGVRFVRMVREGGYDLVVANPPYQGTSKMAAGKYIEKEYPLGKADLFAAFLLRGLQLVREGGVSSMLTMRNWMFIKQYSGLRQHLLEQYDLAALGDLSSGAFQAISAAQVVVSVAMAVFWKRRRTDGTHVALRPFSDATLLQVGETERKRAATVCHVGRHTFDPAALKVVPEWPLVYWWDASFIRLYREAPLMADVSPSNAAQSTGDNVRFVRFCWEIHQSLRDPKRWFPFVNGAEGREWCDPQLEVVNWIDNGIPIKMSKCHKTGVMACSLASEDLFLRRPGVAYSMIGSRFSARVHRSASVFGDKGSSIFPTDIAATVCAMNTRRARQILESLNPSISFQSGDVNRLPSFTVTHADEIFEHIQIAFSSHESHREPSVEFKQPGPSPWRHAQEWAQLAVDRPEGAALPEYVEELDPEPPTDHLSFALGVTLGRFGANGEGILDGDAGLAADRRMDIPVRRDTTVDGADDGQECPSYVAFGILFLDGTLAANDRTDSLGHEAAQPLHQAWATYGARIAPRSNLRDYLREKFFADVHRQMYENRPIHWPLSSEKKTFVAWINIHRWNESTLRVLLADHLQPRLTQLDGELTDLRSARDGADKGASKAAKDRLDDVQKSVKELQEFIRQVEHCADKGPPPTDDKCTPREVDARYNPDLDDGVMINSAALWPLLTPQWKDPKKWWVELANCKGKKDYDWSHLAMRYWPTRVDQKCKTDPSLGVAHGCFWKYHSARAWKWELRLQQEIGPEFRIEEAPYCPGHQPRGASPGSRDDSPHQQPDANALRLIDGGDTVHRAAYLSANAEEALQTIEAEALRRRKKLKQPQAEFTILEPGLWTIVPELCWAIELRVIIKQGTDFRLLSPDEPKARKSFEKAHPDHVAARKRLIDKAAKENLFAAEEDEEESEGVDGEDGNDSEDE